ncbi:acyl-CoA thioesterase [Mesorhizobium sp. B2-9-1]|uniref:acyl-CoA thioesterase n=1 Tax=Mesorhizobium sp. B2-9-1 TaxID=2589898 RepID=UPI0011269F6E|nr:thioesterase family protein [Mesorhizobium sp. B2-9-1]TPI48027.1 acyl-CoA thioesterase [Mesorhizobium sp. B2-9-1]
MILLTRAVVQPWNCDMMGHMTTRFYVAFFDDAINILLGQATGWAPTTPEWADRGWADVRHEIDFVGEVASGVIVEIYGAVRTVGRTSVQTDYEMRRLHGGELAAKLAAKTVFFNLAERKSIPLTETMLQRLKSSMATTAAPGHGGAI